MGGGGRGREYVYVEATSLLTGKDEQWVTLPFARRTAYAADQNSANP